MGSGEGVKRGGEEERRGRKTGKQQWARSAE